MTFSKDPMGSSSDSDSSNGSTHDVRMTDNTSNSINVSSSESNSDESSEESSSVDDTDSDDPRSSRDCIRDRGHSQYASRGSGRGRGHGRCYRGRGSQSTAGRGRSGRRPSSAKCITVEDTTFVRSVSNDFVPIRCPGPQLPDSMTVSPLSLFELYFDDKAVDRILKSTLSYAEENKSKFPSSYQEIMREPLTKEDISSFIGAITLLGIHGVCNHRHAWSNKKHRFWCVCMNCCHAKCMRQLEHFSMSLHHRKKLLYLATICKISPLHDHIKAKCQDLYHPLQQLSVDERMVKSNTRSKFRQYMRNKPTKWGMKYWVIAEITGYKLDFDLYVGKDAEYSQNGLSYDVVMKLVRPFAFQGYEVYFDNFYTSPALLNSLIALGIVGTGTLNVQRRNVPKEVQTMKKVLETHNVPRGTGYYFRSSGSQVTYCVWHDTKTVALASTAYPAHSKETVTRRTKDPISNQSVVTSVPCPDMLMKYNKSMGGVDKSDQYISYHKVSRKTAKYWKTCFFHLVDVALVNLHIL